MKYPDIFLPTVVFTSALTIGMGIFCFACCSATPPKPIPGASVVVDASRKDYQDCGGLCKKSGGFDRIENVQSIRADFTYCVCKDKTMQVLKYRRMVP